MKTIRSMLFMPGNNPGMLVSADILEADAIIYDLEDAVAIDEKDAARDLVSNALKKLTYKNSLITVRINPTDTPFWEEDLIAVLQDNLDAIVIPKASAESIRQVDEYIHRVCESKGIKNDFRYYALIESAMSVINCHEIVKSSDRIDGLLLGGEDYSADMQVERTEGSVELQYARYKIATIAKAYGINALDTPFTNIEDESGLVKETNFVKSIGFNGRLVVGPRQVSDINEIFSPTKSEIQYAQEVLERVEEAKRMGIGVFSYRGKMIDKPVIMQAENTLNSAKEWGLL